MAARFFAVISLVLFFALTRSVAADEAEATKAIQAVGGLVLKISADSEDREVALQLAGNQVGDEQLKNVSQVSNVIWLNLAGTAVTDAGLADVANLSRLEKLHLERTKIGDAGLAHLAKLEKLQYLNVYGTNVTDAGLLHLKGLTNLKKLYVWESKVTDEGIKSLHAILPELEIVVGAKLEPPPPPPIPPPPAILTPPLPEKLGEPVTNLSEINPQTVS